MSDAGAAAASGPPTGALVESFDRAQVSGWVDTEPGLPAPEIRLVVDDLSVASVFAAEPLARHGYGLVHGFRFRLADLWDFVGPGNRITVRTAGRNVPIAGQGAFGVPESTGNRSLDELRARLDAGEVFGRTGSLQLSKTLDTQWQSDVLALYDRVRRLIGEAGGHDVVLAYGTLLGAVRERGFIGHDLDFDAAYLSDHHDAAAVVREQRQIAFALIDAGLRVHARPSCLRVSAPDRNGVLINLFHLWVDGRGAVQFPHGAVGSDRLDPWPAVDEIDFVAGKVLVPAAAETVLHHVYGPGWREPDPAFSWATERATRAVDGLLPAAVVEEVYWADFYAHTTYTSGSTFQALVRSRADVPDAVVDIGCGDGRDAYAFAATGRGKVTGLDRSHVGVRQATRKAEQLGLGGTLAFTACDVGDADRLRETLLTARDGEDALLFYLRFFLHSIPEDAQKTLLGVIAQCSRPGDVFAAEFRTDRDEAAAKVHGDHYRRFQNGAAFGRTLRDTYGFVAVLEQEGNGFSPYKGEDPYLYRVIARRL